MSRLRVVDPHIHLWDLRTGIYPHFERPSAGGGNAAICRNYLLEEYLEEGADDIEVIGAVHVEAFPTDPIRETEMIQAVADSGPLPLVLVGNADLTAPTLAALLDRHQDFGVFRGIRQILNGSDGGDIAPLEAHPGFLDGLRQLGQRGLSFDLQLRPAQMPHCAKLAAAAPHTAIVVNHAGLWSERTPAGWQEWRAGMRLLAAQPNVSLKISGLGMLDPGWTAPGIAPIVFECLEIFGADRIMFASNYPVDKLNTPFPALWRAFDSLTQTLSDAERDQLFRDNAIRTYRIALPSSPATRPTPQ